MTFPETPEIVIDQIDRPDERPGVRLRSVPFTRAKMRAALQGA